MFFMSVNFGTFIIGSQKSYGEKHIDDEKLLVVVASVAMSMGCWRFTWSIFMKKIGFKKTYGILIII